MKKPKAINLTKTPNSQTNAYNSENQPIKSEQKFTAVGNKRFDFTLFPDATNMFSANGSNNKSRILI